MGQRALSSIEHLLDVTGNALKDVLIRAQDLGKALNRGSDIPTVIEPEFDISHSAITPHFFSQLLLLGRGTPGVELLEPEAEALAEARALRLGKRMVQEIGFKGGR
jgi:hypothetical protein